MDGRLTQQDLEKVGRMLSRDHGITLKCEGSLAYASMSQREITLPAIPDAGIASPELLRNIRFFLDHEVGHLVGNSSDNAMDVLTAEYGAMGRHIINALEDIRVEAMMAKLW
ncbi:hypothetical protein R0J87_18550, partial [Halomonas sp. SIMBA_159]